jgi:hypothetical protein
MAGESFKKKSKPGPNGAEPTFDLDRWLAGTMRVVKYVDVYGRPGLQAEIDELDAQLRRSDIAEDRAELAARIEGLRTEMELSRVGFKLTSVPDERVEELREAHDDDGFTLAMLAEQCLSPAGMTPDRFAQLRAALGDGYFAQTILVTANAAQQGLGVAVPFSSAASAALRR